MPSDLSIWLIAVPNDGDAEGLLPELRQKLEYGRALPRTNIGELALPLLKVCLRSYQTAYLTLTYCLLCTHGDCMDGSSFHLVGRDSGRLVDPF